MGWCSTSPAARISSTARRACAKAFWTGWRTAGIETRAAVAGTPQAARALARFGNAMIVPHGGEAHAVDGLPVAALGIDRESVVALNRAGLKDGGRPGDAAALRTRRPVRRAADGAAGPARSARKTSASRRGGRCPPAVVERPFLPEPVTWVEEDAGGAVGRGRAAFWRPAARVGVPSRPPSSGPMARSLRLGLETGRPTRDPKIPHAAFPRASGFAVGPARCRFRLRSDPPVGHAHGRRGACPRRASTAAMWKRRKWPKLVDRLGVRFFGPEAVIRFVPVDTHIPERAAHAVPAAELVGKAGAWPAPDPVSPPLRPIHLFDPPQPIEALAEVPDGPPLRFRWRRVLHEIARAERARTHRAPEWWRHDRCDGLTRDYYRLERCVRPPLLGGSARACSPNTSPRAGSCTGCSHDSLSRQSSPVPPGPRKAEREDRPRVSAAASICSRRPRSTVTLTRTVRPPSASSGTKQGGRAVGKGRSHLRLGHGLPPETGEPARGGRRFPAPRHAGAAEGLPRAAGPQGHRWREKQPGMSANHMPKALSSSFSTTPR